MCLAALSCTAAGLDCWAGKDGTSRLCHGFMRALRPLEAGSSHAAFAHPPGALAFQTCTPSYHILSSPYCCVHHTPSHDVLSILAAARVVSAAVVWSAVCQPCSITHVCCQVWLG